MGQSKVLWRAEGWAEKQPDVTKIALGLRAGNVGYSLAFAFVWYVVKSWEWPLCS